MAVMQLSDWFYRLNYSEITQKKIKQLYYENHGSLSVGHYELCRDDIGDLLGSPIISD